MTGKRMHCIPDKERLPRSLRDLAMTRKEVSEAARNDRENKDTSVPVKRQRCFDAYSAVPLLFPEKSIAIFGALETL